MNIAIIGGGAAGLMAALAVPPQHQVLLLERQSPGRPEAAGHRQRPLQPLQSKSHPRQLSRRARRISLAMPWPSSVRRKRWTFSVHLVCLTVTEPSGRVYPMSDSANSVVDVLRLALAQQKNVRLVCGAEVTAIRPGPPFCLTTGEARYTADRVIVTAGGAAGSKLGGGTGGYQLLEALGHSCTKLYPSLAQLRTDPTYRPLPQRAFESKASSPFTTAKSAWPGSRGEIQFTEYRRQRPRGLCPLPGGGPGAAPDGRLCWT